MSGYSYQTSFPLTENPISEGGKWVNGGTTGLLWTNVRSDGTKAYGTMSGASGFNDSVANLAGMGTWDPIQIVSAKVKTSNRIALGSGFGTHVFEEVELLARWTISANNITGYEFTVSVSQDNEYLQINKWNGGLGSFTLLASASSTDDTINDGDIITLTVCGSYIVGLVNGKAVIQVADTSFTSGAPGIGFYYTNDGTTGTGAFHVSDFGLTDVRLSNFGWAYGDCTLAQALTSATAVVTTSNAMSRVPVAGTTVLLGVMVSKVGTTPMISLSVSDATGRTWVKLCWITNSNGTYTSELSIWAAVANGSTMTPISVTASQTFSSGGAAVSTFALGGVAPLASLLDYFEAAVDSTSPMQTAVSSGTNDRSGEVKVSLYGDAGNNSTIAISTPDSLFTEIGALGTPVQVEASATSQIGFARTDAGAAGLTAQTSWTSSANAEALVMVAVLRAAEPNNGVRETHAKHPKPNMRSTPLRPGVK